MIKKLSTIILAGLLALPVTATDFNGDGRDDIAVFRPATGLWAVRNLGRVYYGRAGDIPSAGDYDGDGIADVAVFRPGNGLWAVRDHTRFYFGAAGDIPVPGDYTGAGSASAAIFQQGSGRWAVRSLTRFYFGMEGDLPVPADYSGDGTREIGFFRPSTGLWAIRGLTRAYFGRSGDTPVPAVYDWYGVGGPFVAGIAVYRPTSGLWAVRGLTRVYFGQSGDSPVTGDYNGDSIDEIALFRPTSGLWAIRGVTRAYFGALGDVPVSECVDSTAVSTGTIAGNVSAPGIATAGDIYLVAVKAEHRKHIRSMETETYPYRSRYAAGYRKLTAEGSYAITGLAPGDYAVWAYMDTGGDGGVDHQDFADPVGWYQTTAALLLPVVTVNYGEVVEDADVVLYQPAPFGDTGQSVVSGSGGGTLKTVRGNHVLHVWGTPEERAYSIGYLCAPQILDWVNFVFIEHYCRSVAFYENSFIPSVRAQLGGLYDRYSGELDACLGGMQASSAGTYSFRLQRNLNRDDMAGINSFYFLSNTLVFGPSPNIEKPLCSSAVFWGDKTANAELNRGLIHGKNMEGENDFRKITVNDLLVVAVEPKGGGTRRFLGINWPGFIGADMGMNESGLMLAPHSVSSRPDWDKINMLDYALLYRETLETCTTPQEAWAYWTSAPITRNGGFNTAVSGRYLTAADYPSLTFEVDSYGGETRNPVFMDPVSPYDILTTNTYFVYQGVNPDALQPASYHPGIEADNYRYRAMLEKSDEFAAGGRTIGTGEMIEILRAASRTAQYSGITEYSFIGYPDRGEFALAKEDLVNKILEAPYATFTTFTFGEVFQ